MWIVNVCSIFFLFLSICVSDKNRDECFIFRFFIGVERRIAESSCKKGRRICYTIVEMFKNLKQCLCTVHTAHPFDEKSKRERHTNIAFINAICIRFIILSFVMCFKSNHIVWLHIFTLHYTTQEGVGDGKKLRDRNVSIVRMHIA